MAGGDEEDGHRPGLCDHHHGKVGREVGRGRGGWMEGGDIYLCVTCKTLINKMMVYCNIGGEL